MRDKALKGQIKKIMEKLVKTVNPIYKTAKWLHIRLAVLRRDKHECQECKRYGRSKAARVVHHIETAEEQPKLMFSMSNLISLCNQCHGAMHILNEHRLSKRGEDLRQRHKLKINAELG